MLSHRAPNTARGLGRWSPRLLATVVLVAMFLAPLPTRSHAEGVAAATARLRIGVTTDGITTVSPANLSAAGVDPASVDPRTFAMTSLGKAVAIQVTGEGDGHFDAADRIYFFGQRFRGPEMDQKYTAERVYWLDIGGAPGPRIPGVIAQPKGDLTPPQHFAATVRAEESREWWALHTLNLDTQDTWFWASLQPIGTGGVATASLSYTIPDPAPGQPATFRLEEISRAGNPAVSPDHRTTVSLNNVALLDQAWDGQYVRQVFSAAVPAGLLVNSTNTVSVGARNTPGISVDWVYANYWEVDYRRLFRAWQGRVDFKAESSGTHEYEVANWPSGNVIVWDVTAAEQPRNLLYRDLPYRQFLPLAARGASAASAAADVAPTEGAATVSIRFRVNDTTGARFWLQDAATVQAPASVRRGAPTGLRAPAGGADAVILTSAALRPAAEQLAVWHRAHGRRALVVDFLDVVDEFNDGIYHPKAVPAMLAWAKTHWTAPAPAYLTLVGDGHWNFFGNNPSVYPASPIHIPPYLAFLDPWQGEIPADVLYGDLDGDTVPEVAVGRLAVNTLAEANTVVAKIVSYDETTRSADWQRRALFVADNPDPATGDYPAVSDEIINGGYLPADVQPVRAYLPGTPPAMPTAEQIAATRAAIFSNIQAGVLMVQYTGHGSPLTWAHELIWQKTDTTTNLDVDHLSNGSRLPIVMSFNCLDGYFPDPRIISLAEAMQIKQGGGAVALISPAGLGTTNDEQRFRKILMDVMFKQGVREIGAALTEAKRQYAGISGPDYLVANVMLYGDPALRLPGPAAQ
jgi:hypothetical protein